jgi:hypothetical protein
MYQKKGIKRRRDMEIYIGVKIKGYLQEESYFTDGGL